MDYQIENYILEKDSTNAFFDLSLDTFSTRDFFFTNNYFWHYTNAEGLKGIVRDNNSNDEESIHLWFTRSDCLNDVSEGAYAVDVFREVCAQLLKAGEISRDFFDCCNVSIDEEEFYYHQLPTSADGTRNGMVEYVLCKTYICSFSEKEDSLDLWRYYSREGYALGFSEEIFNAYECKTSEYLPVHYPELSILRVVYDRKEQEKQIEKTIHTVRHIFEKFYKSDPKTTDNTKRFFINYLKRIRYGFKHECFANEKEIRVFFQYPVTKPEQMTQSMLPVQYRPINGFLIPYIDLKIPYGRVYLQRVMISPYIKQERAEHTVQDYLNQCGVNAEVIHSKLPVR